MWQAYSLGYSAEETILKEKKIPFGCIWEAHGAVGGFGERTSRRAVSNKELHGGPGWAWEPLKLSSQSRVGEPLTSLKISLNDGTSSRETDV